MSCRIIRNYKACFLMSGTAVSQGISETYSAALKAVL